MGLVVGFGGEVVVRVIMFEGGLKDEYLYVGGLFFLRREMRLLSLKIKYITVLVEFGSSECIVVGMVV